MSGFSDFDADATFLTDATDPNSIDALISAARTPKKRRALDSAERVIDRFRAFPAHVTRALRIQASTDSPPASPGLTQTQRSRKSKRNSLFAEGLVFEGDEEDFSDDDEDLHDGSGLPGGSPSMFEMAKPPTEQQENGNAEQMDPQSARLRLAPSFSAPQWQPAAAAMAMQVDLGRGARREEDDGTPKAARGSSSSSKSNQPRTRLSPCGRYVASIQSPSCALLWSVDTAQVHGELDVSAFRGHPASATFSPDSSFIVIQSSMDALAVYQVQTCQLVALLRGKGREGSALVRSPGTTGWPGMEPLMAGDTLVWVGHARGYVRAWSMDGWLQRESSNQIGIPEGNAGRIIGARLDHAGTKLAALLVDAGPCVDYTSEVRNRLEKHQGEGTIKVWELATGEEVARVSVGRCPHKCWFSGDLRRAALWYQEPSSAPSDSSPMQGGNFGRLGSLQRLASLGFAPDSFKQARGLGQQWSRASSSQGASQHPGELEGHEDSEMLPPYHKCVEVWDLVAGENEIRHMDVSSRDIECSFSAKGDRLAVQQDNHVCVWDLEQRLQVGLIEGTKPLALSPDGRLLACSDPLRPVVALWNFEAGTRVSELKAHDDEVLAQSAFVKHFEAAQEVDVAVSHLSWSADSTHLLTSWAPEGTTVLWNISAGAAFHKVEGRFCPGAHNKTELQDVLLGSNSRYAVISRGRSRTQIEIWSTCHGALVSTLQGVTSAVVGFTFIDDACSTAYTCGIYGCITEWDLITGNKVLEDGEPMQEVLQQESASPDLLRNATLRFGSEIGGNAHNMLMETLRPYMHRKPASRDNAAARQPTMVRQDVSSGGWQPSILLATFSTDQDLVAQHYNTGRITIASSVDGSQSSVLGEDADYLLSHTTGIASLAFACSGMRLVSAAKEGTLVVWDTVSGAPVFAAPLIVPQSRRKALTRDARMKPEDLPAWRDVLVEQSPDGVPPNILLHKNSLKVSASGRLVAYLRHSQQSEPWDYSDETGNPSSRAPSMLGLQGGGAQMSGAGVLHGGSLVRRGLPLSMLCSMDGGCDVTVAEVVVQDTVDGSLQRILPLEAIHRALPDSAGKFQPTMFCWSADSKTLAIYACVHGSPSVAIWSLPAGNKSEVQNVKVLSSGIRWSFSTCCLNSDGTRLISSGEDPAIANIMSHQQTEAIPMKGNSSPEDFILPIQVWDVANGSILYSISHHSSAILNLTLSEDEQMVFAYTATGVFSFTTAAAEGMDPDPRQIMRMSAKEEQANFYFECGSKAQALTVGDLLQAHPMLPNMLDGEGRSLVMLAAMQNDEILMHAILGSRHAFQFGLQGGTPHPTALQTALEESPACTSLLLKAMADGKLCPHSTAVGIPEILKSLFKKFPSETVDYLASRGVVELGNFLISSTIGDLDKGMVTTASPYFYMQRPQLLWKGIAGDMMLDSEAKNRANGKRKSRRKRELEVPAVAKVVPLPGCCLPGQKGLLQPLLQCPTVPIRVWGLPIVHAVIAYKWRKFGYRHVIHEFIAYVIWLFTYTVFLLLLPSAQKGTGALPDPEMIDEEDLPGLKTAEGIIATLCLFTSFLFTLRNFWLEMKQIRAYGFKDWASDSWNLNDAVSLSLWVILVPMYCLQVQAWYLNPIVALNSILMWSKLLYFALAFERTSALVRMVLEILYDMKYFLLLLLTMMIGFSCAFYVMFSGYPPGSEDLENVFETPFITMFTMFSMMVGLYEPPPLYDLPMPSVAIVTFVVYEVIIVIVLLNLLIAIMGDSFDKVRETEHLQFMHGRASVIDAIESTLRGKQRENKEWFPNGYIHILQRRHDECDKRQEWGGRIKSIETTQERCKSEILVAVDNAVEAARAALSAEISAKFDVLSSMMDTAETQPQHHDLSATGGKERGTSRDDGMATAATDALFGDTFPSDLPVPLRNDFITLQRGTASMAPGDLPQQTLRMRTIEDAMREAGLATASRDDVTLENSGLFQPKASIADPPPRLRTTTVTFADAAGVQEDNRSGSTVTFYDAAQLRSPRPGDD